MKEKQMKSFHNVTPDQQYQSQSCHTITYSDNICTKSSTFYGPESSNDSIQTEKEGELSFLIKRVTVLWKNQYIQVYFDFYRSMNELHYYLADCYNFPIVGDFFHRLQYLYPMYSLYNQGIQDDNLLVLVTDCYDNYQNRHLKEIFPLLFEHPPQETKPKIIDSIMMTEDFPNQSADLTEENLSTTCHKSRKGLKDCRPLFTREKKRKETDIGWEINSQCSSLTDSNGDSSSDCKETVEAACERAHMEKDRDDSSMIVSTLKFSIDSTSSMSVPSFPLILQDDTYDEAIKLLQKLSDPTS